jgi:hypothetical protein
MACTGYGRSIANIVLLDKQGKGHFLATARCMYRLGSRNATEASLEDVRHICELRVHDVY